jgi:hypothetical protein
MVDHLTELKCAVIPRALDGRGEAIESREAIGAFRN